jgi:hypothetical protein
MINQLKLHLVFDINMTISVNKSGIALILVVIIVGAAALIIALNIALLGLGELDQGYTSQKGGEAFSFADGCMEETLRRLRIDNTYSGGTLNLPNGNCIINVTSNGDNRIIITTSTVHSHSKVLQMDVDMDGSNVITVNSWQEL